MERRLAYPTNPSPVENQYIPGFERNDRSSIYIIPNPRKNATFSPKLCMEDAVTKEKSRVTALRERVRYDSAVHNIISGLKADTDDDENDEEPFPPMPGSKGQISQKDAKHQPQKNDDNIFEFHERISPILMIFLLYHRKQGKCNGYCENNLIVL